MKKHNSRNFTAQAFLPFILFFLLTGSLQLSAHELKGRHPSATGETHLTADVSITGKVVDSAGTGLPGVSVRVKGSSTLGTQTDASGSFALTVPDNATLVVSSVGYETQEVPLNGQTTVTVTLNASTASLEQVVVVGYGTQRKRDLTGAVASIKGEELAKQPVLTATQALQGKTAGVQIISSGAPNSQPTVRIRGTGTMLAGADPLYVVDGVLTTDIRNINTSVYEPPKLIGPIAQLVRAPDS